MAPIPPRRSSHGGGAGCACPRPHRSRHHRRHRRKPPLRPSRHGMALIPGVELTCSVERGEVHLLGYFVSVGDATFPGANSRSFATVGTRAAQAIVAKLQRDSASPCSGSASRRSRAIGAVGRPHVARALIEVGAATSVDDAFDRYLGARPPGARRAAATDAGGGGATRPRGGRRARARPPPQRVESGSDARGDDPGRVCSASKHITARISPKNAARWPTSPPSTT